MLNSAEFYRIRIVFGESRSLETKLTGSKTAKIKEKASEKVLLVQGTGKQGKTKPDDWIELKKNKRKKTKLTGSSSVPIRNMINLK